MKTHFYNRTLYSLLEYEVPEYYLQIDELYNELIKNYVEADHLKLQYIENICKRQADVKYWEIEITNLYQSSIMNSFFSAHLISTYIVAYFSACQALIDSIALMLNEIHNLGLKPFYIDLGRLEFQKKLKGTSFEQFNNYITFYSDLKSWRNIAMHNISPTVMVAGPTSARDGKSANDILREDVDIVIFKDNPINGNMDYIPVVKFFKDWDTTINEITALAGDEFKLHLKSLL